MCRRADTRAPGQHEGLAIEEKPEGAGTTFPAGESHFIQTRPLPNLFFTGFLHLDGPERNRGKGELSSGPLTPPEERPQQNPQPVLAGCLEFTEYSNTRFHSVIV